MTSLVALLVLLWCLPSRADSRRYVLKSGSSITSVCTNCGEPPATPEALAGTFEVTVLPVAALFDVAAVTNVDLSSQSFTLTGNGFLQRLGRDRQAMVLDTVVNEQKVLFTSGRRQYANGRDITIILSSPARDDRVYVIVLSALPADDEVQDSDSDGVGDVQDNCPAALNAAQEDADGDKVGDACDRCVETEENSVVTSQGCSVDQLCPCASTRAGDSWGSVGQYLRCVSRATRVLRREGQISRSQGIAIIRRAARSGCGRTVVALN